MGVNAPERLDIGGLTKKLLSWACSADFVNVAMNVPIPMPDSRHRAAPLATRKKLP